MNNVYWGYTDEHAEVMPPGTTAGEGRCEAGEWGVRVEDIVAYNSLGGLRRWAQSLLDELPPERDGAPLVIVDHASQREWLTYSGVVERIIGADPTGGTVARVHDLLKAVLADPAAVGWTLGDGVAELWAGYDDGVVAGVRLARSGFQVGIGRPLLEDDVKIRFLASPAEQAHACLGLIAERINNAY
ncbi:hypothetical protein ACFY36_50655 [Actinoplanes sp. NPDC000266]